MDWLTLLSVVGDQTTDAFRFVFIVLVVGRGDGGCVGRKHNSRSHILLQSMHSNCT